MKGIAIGPAKQDYGESHGLQAVEIRRFRIGGL